MRPARWRRLVIINVTRKRKIILVGAVVAAAGVPSILACDLCSVYAASEAQGGDGKGFFGAEQFTYFSSLQSEGQPVANDGEHINSLNPQVFVGYNFNQRFGVQLNLPVIYRQYNRHYTSDEDRHDYSPESHDETGIGDISVIGNFHAYQYFSENFTFSWTLLGGIKLPSGGTGELNPANPDFSTGIGGHDLTFGSGSVDGLTGTGFSVR